MAEAIVDPVPPMISRFFCHQCSVEIEHLLPDYTCPRCSTGFIEELERNNPENSNMNPGIDENEDVDVTGMNFVDTVFPMSLFREATRIGNSRRRPRRPRNTTETPYSDTSSQNTRSYNTRSTRRQQQQQPQQQQQQGNLPHPIDRLIQDIFYNLSGIGFGFPQGQGGQPPVYDVRLFLGNPGDYVWGQNGLDTIVTQLLNQMDGTGPPPLSKKLIDEIPTTAVSKNQVETKLQCSVCWEDFILSEPVRKLPCFHYYHAPCIVPWLELHGTCPICRQSLGEQSTADANQDTVGPSLAALFRTANESSNSTSSSSLESSSSSDSQSEV